MEKLFSDYLLEIKELSNGNELLRTMLLNSFYQHIPDDINKNNKKVLNQVSFPLKRKELWLCGHENCEEVSCYSHEISENVFLKELADEELKVVILDRNISGNVVFYRENRIHKRNASNFPGYCSEHDSSLFSDIENSTQSLDEHFVNKQCLRSMHRKRFDLLLQVKMADQMISQVDDDLLKSPEIKQVVNDFQRKKAILLKRVSILSKSYNDVLSGINNQDYLIKFKELSQPKLGYCFSEVLDCTKDEDIEECIIFLLKIDFSTGPKAFICWVNNETSKEFATDMFKHHKYRFIESMYDKKEKLVFSSKFLNQMDESMKKTFLQDKELYNINPVEKALLIQEFF